MREREREREGERKKERQSDRESERGIEKERKKERGSDREREMLLSYQSTHHGVLDLINDKKKSHIYKISRKLRKIQNNSS